MGDSDSDDENDFRYGTPLEPYEEDEIPTKRKYQEPTDQYAVDAHGRRRFHGAFTGGFSAGFGNTVGSQEGWTPTAFKSSRSEKAQSSSQKPEDFMDEEDRSEFGIAPRHMQTHSDFSGQKRSRQSYHDGSIPGEPVLEQVIRAVHETAAVRMLRDMGWRAGQGTGSRLTRKEKVRAEEQQRVYGCYLPEDMRQSSQTEDRDSSDSEFDYDTLFAPDDYEPYILRRKSDRFGLGYQGLSRHSVLGNLAGEYGGSGEKSHLKMRDKGKKVSIRGQAFGVGAFEADDEDIYANEDMSHYDFAIGGPSQDKTKKKQPKGKSTSVLEGFVASSKPLPPVPSYPPCVLPRDYVPAAAGTRRTRFSATDAPVRDQGLGRHELTAEARGILLGEITHKQTNTKEDIIAKITGRNVTFVSTESTTAPNDLTRPNNRTIDKIIDLTTPNIDKTVDIKDVNRPADKIIDFTAPSSNTPDFISIKDSGKEFTPVFKPFASNPAKQTRYEHYLKDNLAERDGNNDRLSEWERERELMEFEQAAKLYKPLTGIMGDRFTHATAPDDSTNPLTAVAKSSTNYGVATAAQISAAEIGAYGVMTRSIAEWWPCAALCKRFNVPPPGVPRSEPEKEDKPKVSYSIFSYLESSVHDKESFTKEQSKFSGSKSLTNIPKPIAKPLSTVDPTDKNVDQTLARIDINEGGSKITAEKTNEGSFKRMTVAELFLKESEKSKEKGEAVTETIDKFDKLDLYKSIFLSDSENEEDIGQTEIIKDSLDDFVAAPKNVQRNTSPPRGIFANIDFDEINSWRRKETDTNKEKDKPNEQTKEISNDTDKMEIEEAYGPKIPEDIQKRLESNVADTKSNESKNNSKDSASQRDVVEIDTSSSDSWVEKEIKDKKKKKKSKHKKQKSKHKKSKHKKKDR